MPRAPRSPGGSRPPHAAREATDTAGGIRDVDPLHGSRRTGPAADGARRRMCARAAATRAARHGATAVSGIDRPLSLRGVPRAVRRPRGISHLDLAATADGRRLSSVLECGVAEPPAGRLDWLG